ncbi:redoxin domain-containing protein [Sphingomonas canadensis]|uniref:thioredoxin-dependent peroxiredoxin n=1 Tax=Sphingomonas canadensis TaxID=1219257 RepID=A0ABW3H0I9_9SPHN|nr:redoxin domain-containing protein [Sphingomonas canadensis]MCW3835104.1 redoxin domain-containing protein [Sphingomonas canadensis]
MRPTLPVAIAAAVAAVALPAAAALQPGAKAPDFTAQGARNGQPVSVNLKAALKKGPVVLYFFPAAYTPGCNMEAAAFADALDDFTKAGATVIGMTAGKTDQLLAFSKEHCAGKFTVAAASPQVIAGYDVAFRDADGKAKPITNRTSYVIAPNGRILSVFSDLNYAGHVRNTLDAVRKYRKSRR